ncbi:hypothetical protein RHSIM_Rhsim08G0063100 [Rhododendron simsii]|uniref:ABC transmembrane type-1 domain-containing protein n=1 Tax=Rhododendron simsii TaxID=118357 RepID=A0A834GSZ5_RHOSS|nr:hypothetical protein RHSIM_Rhsim08G0063100 [Rhododendron simsii]
MREGGMGNQNKSSGSFRSIFMRSDGIDKLLMGLGFIGSVGDGLSMPIMLLFTSKIINNIGGASTNNKYFTHDINKIMRSSCASWRLCKGYHVSLVPVFLMNLFTFIGAYIVAFAVLWRLAIVAFPFVIFLIIPGLMYGRALMGIARKIMVEYDKAGIVVEQALSSIRTVYAFVGESKTMTNYSTALQGTVDLGLKQGLAKGLAIGSNGIVFAISSFMAYYGTRLIMYHNASGGNVFAAGASIAIGGLPSSKGSMILFGDLQNAKELCYVALGQWLACFLEGYCWTRTGARQASRMRSRYLKAVLRQDVGYFDLNVTSTAEVITSVSSDSLAIQDVISVKFPSFLMNLAAFVGCYVVAFIVLWRLAIVAFPFVIPLLIPSLIYGRVLMGIARKIRAEYNQAGTIVEQVISSIRTVYAFAGESNTMLNYSAALQGTVKLGLRQGLAKGLTIGSNGIVYAIWSIMAYYGSRLVMYHGAHGGSVFVVGGTITSGGLSLGSSLSNIRYFSEASAAGERILEVITRVPKIDSENMDGQVLENVLGEVEFKNVEFAYPSRPETPIFTNFNLKIPSGLTVALVGGSGSGKSTVIALLQRFYDPLGGQICLDGVDIDKLQLKWLRSQMGLVSQEPALFATSIKENILFGKEDADMEEIINAAKASNAHNFISQLPLCYDTQVFFLLTEQ